MATIEPYQTKAGKRWRVRYRKPDRRQTDKRGFKTKRDAQLFAATVETAKATGTYIDPTAGNITINELGQAWLQQLTHVRPQTKRAYAMAFTNHIQPRIGLTRINTLTTRHIRAWVADLTQRRSASTVRRAFHVLSSIINSAVDDGLIPTNPAKRIRQLPPPKRRNNVYLTYSQVEALASAAGKYRIPILLAAYCGLRWGEIAALHSEDVLTDTLHIHRSMRQNGTLGETKNGKPRDVGIPEFLRPELSAAATSGGAIFGRLTLPRSNRGWFQNAKRSAGLPETLKFHDLKHSAASFAVAAGANVKVIQNMLGHSSAAISLDTYADLWATDVLDIADRINDARSSALTERKWAAGG